MNLTKTFQTDPTLDEGSWVKLGDAQIKIARLGSPRYQSGVAARLRPHRAEIEAGSMNDKEAMQIEIELLADFIVLDWKNVEFDDAPMPYSRDNAIKALGLELFRNWVREQARNLENFRTRETKEAVAAVAKN